MTEELKKAIELLNKILDLPPFKSFRNWEDVLTVNLDEREAGIVINAVLEVSALIEKALTPSEKQGKALKAFDDLHEDSLLSDFRKKLPLNVFVEKVNIVRSYILSPRADKTLERLEKRIEYHTQERDKHAEDTFSWNVHNDILIELNRIRESEGAK